MKSMKVLSNLWDTKHRFTTLTDAIKDVNLLCRGWAYDGASNMSGHLVATTIRSEEPTALHVHCLTLCLNSCLQDAYQNMYYYW